ncbi:hypothetical protein EHQ81_18835 [Leptospira selangorensis]|uniref:Immunity protein 63 domain-containing protein n=1 Tax=Leptospira selangorensis TaxID=2484982 RepID=A0A5F2BVB6_9LEPT|nr:Imm63 family immunity protein [Leptospira selangorensis]TGM10684.1 hypothetical protein EHQ81_18835 [Leptospira selangorensis]TGM11015.1 hypothetical protein EHQ82_21355 [Leptospira selangorensis]
MKPNTIISQVKKKLQELNVSISISSNLEEEGLCVDKDFWGYYHFKYIERGKASTDRKTKDPNDIFYWLYQSATFENACKYELIHRIEKQDFRRILFEKQLSLLKSIGIEYYERRKKEISDTLVNYPYSDSV